MEENSTTLSPDLDSLQIPVDPGKSFNCNM